MAFSELLEYHQILFEILNHHSFEVTNLVRRYLKQQVTFQPDLLLYMILRIVVIPLVNNHNCFDWVKQIGFAQ